MGCKQSNKKVAAPTSSADGFRNGRNRRGESKVAAKKNEFVSNTFPQKSVGLVQGDRKISWLLCPKSARRNRWESSLSSAIASSGEPRTQERKSSRRSWR